MSQPIQVPDSIKSSKSLSKLYLHLSTRGSTVTATNYVSGVRQFATHLKVTPDELIAQKRDWATSLNEYITEAAQLKKSPRSISTVNGLEITR